MTVPRTPDVLVIGGEASSAAAGVLGVASGDDEGERQALRRASLATFPALAGALRDETGIDVGFARCGALQLACTQDDLAGLEIRAARRRAQAFRAELLDAGGVRALEPAATPDALGGICFPDEAVVVAERLVTAFAEAARRRGATIVPGLPVLAVERAGARVTRVRVGPDWITPGLVVLATGAWGASPIADLDVGVAVVPVRGQMMAVRPARAPRHALTSGNAFLIPRPHGEVWIGATFEDAGFVKAVTADGLRMLAAHLSRLAPAMIDAPIVRAWAGLRPLCPDGGPVLGRPCGFANLLVALGHHRSGILLAPITARTIAACADEVAAPAEAEPFLLGARAVE